MAGKRTITQAVEGLLQERAGMIALRDNVPVDKATPSGRDILIAMYDGAVKLGARNLLEATNLPGGLSLYRRAMQVDAFKAAEATELWAFDAAAMNSVATKVVSWPKLAPIGIAPKAPSGSEAPMMNIEVEDTVNAVLERYAVRAPVTEDNLLYSEIDTIQETVSSAVIAVRAAMNKAAITDILTKTASYASGFTGTASFSLDEFAKASAKLKSVKNNDLVGAYMGTRILAGTIAAAKASQMATSQIVDRGGTATDVFGAGNINPFFGVLTDGVIATPLLGDHEWILFDARPMMNGFKGAINGSTSSPVRLISGRGAMNDEWLRTNSFSFVADARFVFKMVRKETMYYNKATT